MDIYQKDLTCKYCESSSNSDAVEFRGEEWHCPHCRQWNHQPDELEQKLCKLAEDHITNEYYCAGNRSYAWDEADYDSDDLDGNVVCGECPPSDADNYSWWEVTSSEIISSELTDRNDETGEYCVEVDAWIAVASGDQDEEIEDMEELPKPDCRTIYVHIQRYEDGDYGVDLVEE